MFGLFAKISTTDGNRDALIDILLEGTQDMPGCLHYVISKDMDDETLIWISEVWESEESHKASLTLPAVQNAIGKGRSFIAGMEQLAKTEPVGGHGLR